MARPKSLVPKLCIDKSQNRAYCKVDGKFITLGPAGSPESQAAYGQLLTQLAHKGSAAIESSRQRKKPADSLPAITLNDLFLRFLTTEIDRYALAEQRCLKSSIRFARELFSETPIQRERPLANPKPSDERRLPCGKKIKMN